MLDENIRELLKLPFNEIKQFFQNDVRKGKYGPKVEPMTRQSEKFSIFETIEGCHDKRFVAFNDIPQVNSKFKSIGVPDIGLIEGREKVTHLNPEPPVMSPDYDIRTDQVARNLRQGSVVFS